MPASSHKHLLLRETDACRDPSLYGMLRLVGRTPRHLVTDCPVLLDTPRHRRPGLLDARRGASSRLKPVVDARHDPSSLLRLLGRMSRPLVTECSGWLDARRDASSLLTLAGRTSRPLVTECSGWLDAHSHASSRTAQACWTRLVIVVRSLRRVARRTS